jgi:hypothetical protein
VLKHKEKPLVYLAHARTGSTSTHEGLFATGEWDVVGKHHAEFRDMPGPQAGLLRITNIRNPFDLAVSAAIPRTNFVMRDGWKPRWEDFQRGFSDMSDNFSRRRLFKHYPADFLIHFENLQEGWWHLSEALGIATPKVGGENERNTEYKGRYGGRHWRDFYTDETREKIAAEFDWELHALGYTFDKDGVV